MRTKPLVYNDLDYLYRKVLGLSTDLYRATRKRVRSVTLARLFHQSFPISTTAQNHFEPPVFLLKTKSKFGIWNPHVGKYMADAKSVKFYKSGSYM